MLPLPPRAEAVAPGCFLCSTLASVSPCTPRPALASLTAAPALQEARGRGGFAAALGQSRRAPGPARGPALPGQSPSVLLRGRQEVLGGGRCAHTFPAPLPAPSSGSLRCRGGGVPRGLFGAAGSWRQAPSSPLPHTNYTSQDAPFGGEEPGGEEANAELPARLGVSTVPGLCRAPFPCPQEGGGASDEVWGETPTLGGRQVTEGPLLSHAPHICTAATACSPAAQPPPGCGSPPPFPPKPAGWGVGGG